MKVTPKPWGEELLIHQGHDYAVKRIVLRAGGSTSLHYHERKHETIMVLQGELSITLGENVDDLTEIRLCSGDFVAIEPMVIHRMQADSEDCTYFESQSDFLDDVIRISDSYGRAN